MEKHCHIVGLEFTAVAEVRQIILSIISSTSLLKRTSLEIYSQETVVLHLPIWKTSSFRTYDRYP